MKWSMKDIADMELMPYKACHILSNGYRICKLTKYISALEDDYAYVFTPDWEQWELAGRPDIDGLNLDLHLDNYVRINMLPNFCSLRYIPMDRPDWRFHYDMHDVPFELGQDQWEFMMYSHGKIHENRLTVERCEI